mgnify:CR=1 FL=1
MFFIFIKKKINIFGKLMNIILENNNAILSYLSLIIFIISYILVICENFLSLKKCIFVIFGSGLIWFIIGIMSFDNNNEILIMKNAIIHYFYTYINLFLFLLISMIYINVLKERNFFLIISKWVIKKKINSKKLFLLIGFFSFFLSPIIDNLTTALIASSIIISIDEKNNKFINLCCINIVIASNAGGAFSPFGDITTLMVWQYGILNFIDFFKILIPSFFSFLIPCLIIYLFVDKKNFIVNNIDIVDNIKFGSKRIICLFILTIIITIFFEHYLSLPASMGMMTGFVFLCFFGLYIKNKEKNKNNESFDIFKNFEKIEWDTLLFFYGIIMVIGGLATLGYLKNLSFFLYEKNFLEIDKDLNITFSNIIIGILSAFIDNIPVMFSILTMNPEMSKFQWLLVTLTTGIGGSLLSIGSAAGVALMGYNRGIYTFISHLKWSWVIIIGYFLGIYFHIIINKF